MNNELIEELSKLELQKKHLIRCLDSQYYSKHQRTKTFEKIKDLKKQIEKVKFKIRLNKEIKNVKNNNTNESNN